MGDKNNELTPAERLKALAAEIVAADAAAHKLLAARADNLADVEIGLTKKAKELAGAVDVLRRLAGKVERVNAVQHAGGRLSTDDWSELFALVNEAKQYI